MFKKGDCVRCVDGFGGHAPVQGKVYTVRAMVEDSACGRVVQLKDFPDPGLALGWYPERFVLVYAKRTRPPKSGRLMV